MNKKIIFLAGLSGLLVAQSCAANSDEKKVESTTAAEVAVVKKKMFVTASTYNGNLGGIAGADAKCAADANKPATGTYKALIVGGVSPARAAEPGSQQDWVLGANTEYYRLDGTTLLFKTNSSGVFTFGTLDNALSGTSSITWTGLNSSWVVNANTCISWSEGVNNYTGASGLADRVNSAFIRDGLTACDVLASLICVEQ